MSNSFNDTDSLVLSVIYEHSQIDIAKWIGMIDFYERTILTFNEFSDALAKLQKCGLIQLSDNECLLSSEALKLFPKKFSVRNYEKIYNKLLKKNYTEISDNRYILTEEEYLTALSEYKKTMQKAMRIQ